MPRSIGSLARMPVGKRPAPRNLLSQRDSGWSNPADVGTWTLYNGTHTVSTSTKTAHGYNSLQWLSSGSVDYSYLYYNSNAVYPAVASGGEYTFDISITGDASNPNTLEYHYFYVQFANAAGQSTGTAVSGSGYTTMYANNTVWCPISVRVQAPLGSVGAALLIIWGAYVTSPAAGNKYYIGEPGLFDGTVGNSQWVVGVDPYYNQVTSQYPGSAH